MNHKGTIRMETGRLILRPFAENDAEAMFHNWAKDERVTKYLTWQPHRDVNDTKKTIDRWIAGYSDLSFYQWAIELKAIHEPIGSISIVGEEEKTATVQFGYCIGYPWWHQGITGEALATLIPFFFNEVGANRIEAKHDPQNPNSGNVMKKCGLRYEGTLRQAALSNQGIVDVCMYSLLRSEWRQGE